MSPHAAERRGARVALAALVVLNGAALAVAFYGLNSLRNQNDRLKAQAAGIASATAELRRQAIEKRAELVSGCERGNTLRRVIREAVIQGDIDAGLIVAATSTSAAIRAYYARVRLPHLRAARDQPDIAEQDCESRFK